jgi:hypothetical protein
MSPLTKKVDIFEKNERQQILSNTGPKKFTDYPVKR